MAKVVELMRRKGDGNTECLARFVLTADGSVDILGVHPNGAALAEDLVREGIPGPGDRMVQRAEGLTFLAHLREAFRGSRLWATDVLEVDDTGV